jgi:hypothetical protein
VPVVVLVAAEPSGKLLLIVTLAGFAVEVFSLEPKTCDVV